MLFADASEGAGWAVVSTLAALVLTFIATARRDRNKADNEAVEQWRVIAESAMAAKDEAEARLDKAMSDRATDRAKIATLQAELRYLKGGRP